jgi:voltage-gated potassium channel
MRRFFHKIVIVNNSKRGRWFDIFIQCLIILSLISFSIETLPGLDTKYHTILYNFEVFSILVFSAEYLLRVYLTKSSWRYIFSFFGIIDFLAVLPFYLSTGIDLRSIRILRLFRLFRIFKLLKYNTALDRINSAFNEIKNEMVIFIIATIFLIYISAIGIYYFENPVQPDQFKSIFHSMWWAVGAIFGYGDLLPITIGGKIFSTIIVFIGIGLIAIPTGLLASAFSKTLKNDNPND